MMWRRSCPRCRGDLALESDFYGQCVSCIQCGNVLGGQHGSSLLHQSSVALLGSGPAGVRSAPPEKAGAPAG
jgi:hypothetical protein